MPIPTISNSRRRKPPTRRNSTKITSINNVQSRNFLKDMSSIGKVVLAECKIILILSDKPRKQGGGRGNIGDINDLQKPDRYIKEG